MNTLFELISEYWEIFKVFQIVSPTEGGVHMRNGHYLRTLETGIWFKLPIVDLFNVTNTALTTMSLATQTINAKIVGAIIRYEITDVQKNLLSLWDAEDVLRDTVMGDILYCVERHPDLTATEVGKRILPRSRNEVKEYGIRIHKITFTDFGTVPSVRIILDSMTD